MKRIYFYILIVCIFLIGCQQKDEVSMSSKGDKTVIEQGTVGRIKDLSIGVLNVLESDYTNDLGEKKHSLIARLSLLYEGFSSHREDFEVYPGKIVKWQGYSIYIQDIYKDQEKLKKHEEMLREAVSRNLPPPTGSGPGVVVLWIKK